MNTLDENPGQPRTPFFSIWWLYWDFAKVQQSEFDEVHQLMWINDVQLDDLNQNYKLCSSCIKDICFTCKKFRV